MGWLSGAISLIGSTAGIEPRHSPRSPTRQTSRLAGLAESRVDIGDHEATVAFASKLRASIEA